MSRVPEDQFSKLIDRLAQCDFDCLQAVSQLEAARTVRARNQNKIDEAMKSVAAIEFKKDPRVVAMVAQIDESRKLAESQQQSPPPAVLAARQKLETLSNGYDALWESEYPGIRKRLAERDQGMLSDAKIGELELAVETAMRLRTAYAKQLEKIKVVEKPPGDDTFEAVCLNYQLNCLLNREDQVKQHLEQLAFEAGRDHYRVTLLDTGSAPTNPSNDKRVAYIAAAPGYVFFVLLGLFLVQAIMAGRSPEMRYARKPG